MLSAPASSTNGIVPKTQTLTYPTSTRAFLIDNHASIIDRSGAGVVRLMGAVASDHGNGIRGASRVDNPS